MKRSAPCWLSVLVVVAACGGDDKPGENNNTGDNNNGGTSNNNSGGEDGGGDNGSSTGGRGDPVTDAENCAEDDPSTPGVDCKGIVSCGGSPAAPHACPTATHSCCTADFPSEETVNCFAGTSSCTADETATPCDGPEDCSDGEVCCVTIGVGAATACTTSCGGSELCHTADDCAPGESCKAFSRSDFWAFCG